MKTLDQYVAQFKSTSVILHPEKGDIYGGMYLSEDLQNLRTHHELIAGKFGYFNGAKEQLEKVADKFLIHQQTAVNSGEYKPTEYPNFLQEEQNLWQAKIKVFNEELKEIEAQIIKVEKAQEDQDTKVLPRRQWGSCRLRGGIIYRIGGWKVLPNKSGILAIADPRSPFNGMTLPRFKSEVLFSISKETSFRQRQAIKIAKQTGKPVEPPKHVKTPYLIEKSGEIFYPDFSRPWVQLNQEKLNKQKNQK